MAERPLVSTSDSPVCACCPRPSRLGSGGRRDGACWGASAGAGAGRQRYWLSVRLGLACEGTRISSPACSSGLGRQLDHGLPLGAGAVCLVGRSSAATLRIRVVGIAMVLGCWSGKSKMARHRSGYSTAWARAMRRPCRVIRLSSMPHGEQVSSTSWPTSPRRRTVGTCCTARSANASMAVSMRRRAVRQSRLSCSATQVTRSLRNLSCACWWRPKAPTAPIRRSCGRRETVPRSQSDTMSIGLSCSVMPHSRRNVGPTRSAR